MFAGRTRLSSALHKPRHAIVLAVLICILAVMQLTRAGADQHQSALIAAASSLRFALDEIASDFKTKTGLDVRLTYGSSGTFFRQIRNGAPFELFLSADAAFVSRLYKEGRTLDSGRQYATGRLVLFLPAGSSVGRDPAIQALGSSLKSGRLRRLAIANPEHAPYGRAAKEALEALQLWQPLKAHFVVGENVSQAAQFALSGSADAGIFAYSLVKNTRVDNKGRYQLIPERYHQPIVQKMVLMKNAGSTAKRFFSYIMGNNAQGKMSRFGLQRAHKR